MQSAELWMIFAKSEHLQLFKFSCFYNVNLMRKTDEGGFQPKLCTLHSALTHKPQFIALRKKTARRRFLSFIQAVFF